MAAMGLPTTLRPHTHHAGRGDDYEVYTHDEPTVSAPVAEHVPEEPAAPRARARRKKPQKKR